MVCQTVQFPVDGLNCGGRWWPAQVDDLRRNGDAPVVIMGHGFAATIDCRLDQYAERFAALGMNVLAFDYRHFGLSEGEPRQLLSISKQHKDWHGALAFVRSLPNVDKSRIALWGTSFAGGHVVPVAVSDREVCAVVSQCPMMDGFGSTRKMINTAGLPMTLKVFSKGVADAVSRLVGLSPVMIPVASVPGQEGLLCTEDSLDGFGLIVPEDWQNQVCATIGLEVGMYRPGLKADKLPCPILIVACDDDTVAPVEAAVAAAKLAGDKATLVRYPVKHFEIYVSPHYEKALSQMERFLLARMR